MIARIILLAPCLFLLVGSPVVAESLGRYTPQPIKEDKFVALAAAVDKQQLIQSRRQSRKEQGPRWSDWNRNEVAISSSVRGVRLLFRAPHLVDLHGQDSHGFVIDLTYDYSVEEKVESRFLLEHKPFASKKVQKIDIEAQQSSLWGAYLSAPNYMGIQLIVPGSEEESDTGLVICPRIMERGEGQVELRSSPYVLEEVGFRIVASAAGRVQSGFGPGIAQASIETSQGAVVATPAVDMARGRYPFANVVLPVSQDVPMVSFAGAVTGGARSGVSLTNSLGQFGQETVEEVLTIRLVQLEQKLRIRYQNEHWLRAQPGQCYALLKERRSVSEYRKAVLALPSEDRSRH